MKLNQK
jgi:Na+/H+-translocating membrane pyrophosphatase